MNVLIGQVNKQNTSSTHISQTDECIVAIQQAASWVLPVDRLRGLFVMLMGVFCEADSLSVWDATWDVLFKDVLFPQQIIFNDHGKCTPLVFANVYKYRQMANILLFCSRAGVCLQ